MNILVVEDRPAHADLVCTPLEKVAEIILVDSVEDAKNALAKNSQISCIILDLQIYKYSKISRDIKDDGNVDTEHGIELLKYLINEFNYPPNQIFVTTVHTAKRNIIKKYVPAKQIIAKPFSSARLRSRVENLLRNIR